MYYSILPELKAVPEVLEHIHMSHGKIPFAVVSGSTRDSVTRSLRRLEFWTGLRRWFVRGTIRRVSRIRSRF